MCYTTKVGPNMANTEMKLAVHMRNPGPEHWKALGSLIGYLKGKDTKYIIIRKHKVLKAVMLCNSDYATDKETRNSVYVLVATIVGTLIT